jgi:type II secretion system protein J
MRRGRIHPGFTLIELILAMAIAAVLSLMLYETLHTALLDRQRAVATAQSTRAGAVAMDLICRDLESVVRPAPSQGTAAFYLNGVFQGAHRGGTGSETDDLLFHAIENDATADPNDPLAENTREVEFYISNDTNPPALVRRVNNNLLAPMQTNGTIEVLCRNVHGFAVQYFDGQQWQTDWDSTQNGDVLPFAVRVTLTLVDPSGATQQDGQPVTRQISRTVQIPLGKVSTVPEL